MAASKTKKELAFIQDLLIAPDWGERFASLIDEHVKAPKKGRLLYLGAGSGGHALGLRQRSTHEFELVCVDENAVGIEIARAKAVTLKVAAEFAAGSLDVLGHEDNKFDQVIGDFSLLAPERVAAIIAEAIRVAKPGAQVAFTLPTASSFGEFFSLFWEALFNSEFAEAVDLESLLNALPTVSQVEASAVRAGLEEIASFTQIEGFEYASGEEFLAAPLIADYLMKGWMASIPKGKQKRVTSELARLINAEGQDAGFLLTIKATIVVGRKRNESLGK